MKRHLRAFHIDTVEVVVERVLDGDRLRLADVACAITDDE